MARFTPGVALRTRTSPAFRGLVLELRIVVVVVVVGNDAGSYYCC